MIVTEYDAGMPPWRNGSDWDYESVGAKVPGRERRVAGRQVSQAAEGLSANGILAVKLATPLS